MHRMGAVMGFSLLFFALVSRTSVGCVEHHRAFRAMEMYVDQLPEIPKLYAYAKGFGSPKSINRTIGMFAKKWKFHRDLPSSNVFVYGTTAEAATFPGPVLEALQGVPFHVKWENHLPHRHILPWDHTIPTAIASHGGVPTVVHLHGGIHEPQSDGNPLAWFTAGFEDRGPTWSEATQTYPNVQHPGNLWYHDHALGLTRANILAGLFGPYVVRNPKVEARWGLPSGRAFDRHLVIVDRSFHRDGSIYMNTTGIVPHIHPEWQPEYFGDTITVNGKIWPFLHVKRRRYRFRILNASNARYFRLSLSNRLHFVVVGSDASYLPQPLCKSSILVAPAEIFDVIIDFSMSKTREVELMNSARYPFPRGTAPNLRNGKIMKFVIAAGTAEDPSRIPTKLVKYPAASTHEATLRRYITLYEYRTANGEPTHLYINGKRFEDQVTETPKAGSTEVWEVINLTGDNHPLHIHLAEFQAIKVREIVNISTFRSCMTKHNNAVRCHISSHARGRTLAVPKYEKTWKNVVKIEPGHMTTVVVKFSLIGVDSSYPFDETAEPGYVYHCHVLDHEDNAMIRPLKLVR